MRTDASTWIVDRPLSPSVRRLARKRASWARDDRLDHAKSVAGQWAANGVANTGEVCVPCVEVWVLRALLSAVHFALLLANAGARASSESLCRFISGSSGTWTLGTLGHGHPGTNVPRCPGEQDHAWTRNGITTSSYSHSSISSSSKSSASMISRTTARNAMSSSWGGVISR